MRRAAIIQIFLHEMDMKSTRQRLVNLRDMRWQKVSLQDVSTLYHSTIEAEMLASGDLADHGSLRLRDATHADLKDIVDVVQRGFADDPEMPYWVPLLDKYPEDQTYRTQRGYRSYLDQPQKYTVRVVEMTIDASVEPLGPAQQLIAVAAWDTAVETAANDRGKLLIGDKRRGVKIADFFRLEECVCCRQDADRRRAKEYERVMADDAWFRQYRLNQFRLENLVPAPEFRRRGAATMLINWAILHEKRWPLTVFPGPQNVSFYQRFGFEPVATRRIQVKGEEEAACLPQWSFVRKMRKASPSVTSLTPSFVRQILHRRLV